MKFQQTLAVVASFLTASVYGADNSSAHSPVDSIRHQYNAGRNLTIGWIVFNGYAPLDIWGPLSIVSALSSRYNMTLVAIHKEKGALVNNINPYTRPGGSVENYPYMLRTPSILATHTPEDAPPLDLLMVPGGSNYLTPSSDNEWIEAFVRSRYASTDYVASVCSGAVSLARAGIMDGKRATTNKWAWADLVKLGPKVEWVPNARWVADDGGKLWTSSGVAAGMDMMYALMSYLYGAEKVDLTMNAIELSPHTDSAWDPYAVVHKVPGANVSRSLFDLVGPAGYAPPTAA
ncbi:class I glutamine amidotransferase-like protein [Massariosphaeria phaeospora]|uniref:Class I glutamine amidotransferase-like protein n=1 Tax=Massariosphaeria phaeospora TaxID=100035 RepID=A0A7C8MAV6_9PLEO|nr:class I glutamine amidotransferase-like protein [Massariosphaeria phaeospora]